MFALHDFHHHASPDNIKTAAEIEQDKSISRYIDDPDCIVYVAVDIDKSNVVGFITGHFCELISAISKPIQMGSVDELFVVSEYRNQMVAHKLMCRVENTFDDYGVKKIFIEVWDFNKPAIEFYQKNGFVHHIHWLCKTIA